MNDDERRIASNRELWEQRTRAHLQSDFYDVAAFRAGKCSLNSIELDALGDVSGKSLLHLQCHFGQDTLSWARRGAIVTGVDYSETAIAAAKQLSAELSIPAEFVCSDVYGLASRIDRTFDVVFTSYGVLGWLPDLGRWAQIVARCLKPAGVFLLVEFHPVVWMFDDDFEKVAWPYLDRGVIETTTSGSYAAQDLHPPRKEFGWNHGLSEVVNALISSGLRIDRLDEFDWSPYPCFRGAVPCGEGRWRIARHGDRLPLVYSLAATKSR